MLGRSTMIPRIATVMKTRIDTPIDTPSNLNGIPLETPRIMAYHAIEASSQPISTLPNPSAVGIIGTWYKLVYKTPWTNIPTSGDWLGLQRWHLSQSIRIGAHVCEDDKDLAVTVWL